MKKNKLFGFTLAELLITLTIIGLIAAMTIPTLMSKYREKVFIVKLKKMYSTISTAYQFAQNIYGTADNWDLAENPQNLINYVSPYLKVVKICDGVKVKDCYNRSPERSDDRDTNSSFFNGDDPIYNGRRSGAILADGTVIGTYMQSANCSMVSGTSEQLQTICGEYLVDLNGSSPPNKFGIDAFVFNITKYGIVPIGSNMTTAEQYSINSCFGKAGTRSWGCAAWVIYKENMDYLRCKDLSWNGKDKCSK